VNGQHRKTLQVKLTGRRSGEVSAFDLATFTLVSAMRGDTEELENIGRILVELPRDGHYWFQQSLGDKLLHFSRRVHEAGGDLTPGFEEVSNRITTTGAPSAVQGAVVDAWRAIVAQPADVIALDTVRRKLLAFEGDEYIEASNTLIAMVSVLFSLVGEATDNERAMFEICGDHDSVMRLLPGVHEVYPLALRPRGTTSN
jgi:hypothetical protein